MFFQAAVVSLFAVAGVSAAPPRFPPFQFAACSLASAQLPPAANISTFVPPTTPPKFIAAAIGVQNYTCTNSSTFSSAGAVATLFDVSCLLNTPAFNTIQDRAFTAWKAAPASVSAKQVVATLPGAILGDHYFITNPTTGTGISPKWDFTASQKDSNAFVVAAKVANIAAPTGAADVDWLSLKSVQGSLATQVFRTDTRSGQPPASCTFGSTADISVKYASKYYLY